LTTSALWVRDLNLQKRAIERRAGRSLELCHSRVVILGHLEIGPRRGWRHAEFLREITTLLAHGIVIVREHLAERLHIGAL
jgi:hypothetical protein